MTKMPKFSHAFPLIRDCIKAISQSHFNIMNVADVQGTCQTLKLTSDLQKHCEIIPIYG